MSLQIEAIVDELSKIPAYGKELEGIRIHAAVVDGPGYVSVPIDLELGLVPPKIGDTLRVEATWGPINEPFPEDVVDVLDVPIPTGPFAEDEDTQ